jgi:hypothetical protein
MAGQKDKDESHVVHKALIIGGAVTLCLTAVLFLAIWPDPPNKDGEILFYIASLFAGPASTLALVTLLLNRGWTPRALVVSALPSATFAGGFVAYQAAPSLMARPIQPYPFFAGVLFAICILALAELRPKTGPHWLVRTASYLASALICIGLLDPSMVSETMSYGPYVGPALAVLDGRLPLIDVYSQYGLSYLVFSAAIAVSNYSMPAIALTVSVVNVVMFLTSVAIVARLFPNKPVYSLLVPLMWIFIVASYPFNITYNPSVFGFRFLPLFLLVASLIRGRLILPTIFLWVATIWSVETAAAGLCLFATGVFISERTSGSSLCSAISKTALRSSLVLVPLLCVSAVYYAAFQRFPNIGPYLEIIGSYVRSNPYFMPNTDGTLYFVPNAESDRLFLLHVATYSVFAFLSLAFIFWPNSIPRHLPLLCAFGLLCFMYFAGRSMQPLLYAVSFPWLLCILIGFDWTMNSLRIGSSLSAWLGAGVCGAAIALCSGLGVSRFMEPFLPVEQRPSTMFGANNVTMLRACIADPYARSCGLDLARLRRSPPFAPENHLSIGLFFDEAKEAYETMHKEELRGYRAFDFVTNSATVHFYRGEAIQWGLSDPIGDGVSTTLVERAVSAAVQDVREGDILVISQDPVPKPAHEILDVIRARWFVCEVNREPNQLQRVGIYLVSSRQCPFPRRN